MKYFYNTEEEIPAEVKSHYAKGQDGKWYIQIEGMVPKIRVDEFRTKNTELLKENGELKERVTAFEGITDIDRAKELLQMDADGRLNPGSTKPEIEKRIVDELDKRTRAMREENIKRANETKAEYDKRITDLVAQNTEKSARLEAILIDEALVTAAVKRGVLPTAMDDVKARGRGVFKLEGTDLIPTRNGEKLYSKDGVTLMTPDEYMEDLMVKAPHCFPGNKGGGAGGGGGGNKGGSTGPNPFKAGSINFTRQAIMLKENPQEAARLRAEAGVT